MPKFTEQIKKGSTFRESFAYTQNDVDRFAEISGDKNPIHLDEAYAAQSIFKRRIIHGYLGTSVFSKVFAMDFPGEGTIYLKQDLKFMKPMFADTQYTAVFEVIEHMQDRHRALVSTYILNNNNEEVVTGEALIQNSKFL
ncbi:MULTISPECIES: MaoC family dehydratase [Winogradskyella]|uniref:Dehydrogenase n=1 Tax=Winogradskyella ouciana TaxID=2608631 RepID=A0A7K1GD24_9FLAO|nr:MULTISPECIES: MaoC family dehydratase [Winogradskyella]MBO6879927.1 MaoC family dehydratase [Winogradskyella sp.]MTE27210.1 dehydrogenase [Winogradskyella ouciana]